MILAAMIAEIVSAADSIRSYRASMVRRAGGRGSNFNVTSVMIPSVPSLPTNKSRIE